MCIMCLRHNGLHFWNISTSKSAPRMVCFVHFGFEICFATTASACTFWTSQLTKVLREWRPLYILTSKYASRHHGVQFFISHLPRCFRSRHISEPTFLSGATKDWKNSVLRLFQFFRAPASSFLPLFLLSDLLPSHLLFSDALHLCFSICPYCRKFDF